MRLAARSASRDSDESSATSRSASCGNTAFAPRVEVGADLGLVAERVVVGVAVDLVDRVRTPARAADLDQGAAVVAFVVVEQLVERDELRPWVAAVAELFAEEVDDALGHHA